jgi:hypothetical protein
MPRDDFQQGQCRPLGSTSILFPVSQRVNADLERIRELDLRHTHETAERDDVRAGRDLPPGDALALPAWDGARKIGRCQFTISSHLVLASILRGIDVPWPSPSAH